MWVMWLKIVTSLYQLLQGKSPSHVQRDILDNSCKNNSSVVANIEPAHQTSEYKVMVDLSSNSHTGCSMFIADPSVGQTRTKLDMECQNQCLFATKAG